MFSFSFSENADASQPNHAGFEENFIREGP